MPADNMATFVHKTIRVHDWYLDPPEPGLVMRTIGSRPMFSWWWLITDVHPGRLAGRFRLDCLRWAPSDDCPVEGVDPGDVVPIYRPRKS